MPHHRAGTFKLLGADDDRASVQRAIDGWEAFRLEDAAPAAGLVVTATRSFTEWDAHPQGRAVAGLPPFTIDKIGDAPPRPLPAGLQRRTGRLHQARDRLRRALRLWPRRTMGGPTRFRLAGAER